MLSPYKVKSEKVRCCLLYTSKTDMAQSWHLDKSKPYPAYLLSNNNANIRRVRPVSYTHLDVYKRQRLERVEADVMGNFKRLGVPSEPMDGRARLALLHSQDVYKRQSMI